MLIYRRVLVMALVAMFIFPMLGIRGRSFTIQESTQALAQPAQLWNGFVKHEWQPFLEQRLLIHMGSLRSFLVLSYNETKHRLFPTRPNNNYIWTPEIGYYPVDTIRRLNDDALHHDTIGQHYQRAARRLRILQELLSHHGVAMLVVTPPPKVRIYPEYVSRYLLTPVETILSRAISYGDVLEEGGVHVLNMQRIFSERKSASRWPFFTTTSFHWSIWAGCTVADEIMRKGETLTGGQFFRIDCSDVEYGKSKLSDTDIASILNIFSTDAIVGQAPFPKIVSQKNPLSTPLKMMVIGDSFSDQITSALTKALPETDWSPDWLTMIDLRSSVRQRFRIDGEKTPVEIVQGDSILPEILGKNLVIVEVSDGHTFRHGNLDGMEFGLTRSLLDGLLLDANGGAVDPRNFLLDGWSAVGHELWRTTGPSASFVIRAEGRDGPIQLMLDIENKSSNQNTPRILTILADGHPIGQTKMLPGRREVGLQVPNTVQWHDPLVAEITLRDDAGQPLDILLRGVRRFGSDRDKEVSRANTADTLVTAQTLSHTGMKTINLISSAEPADILVEGLGGFESNGTESWRWALGPATRIKFYVDLARSDQTRQLLLKFAFKNGLAIPGQTVTIRLNSKEIRRFSSEEIGVHKQVNADMVLAAKKGVNVLEIVCQDWNHGKKSYANGNDPRKLAVAVMQLSLQAGK